MPKTYTVKEVADILGFSTNSIYTFLKEKRIKGVRVGKGRFRIPDEELSRILHLSKKPQVAASGSAVTVTTNAVLPEPLVKTGDAAIFTTPELGRIIKHDGTLVSPNIFDWFVGLAAIIAGVGLFLFNSPLVVGPLVKFALVYPIIRIVLIAAGLGLIISGIVARNRFLYKFFQIALVLMGLINAFGLARNGDIEGAMLYGAMALVILITNILSLGGIVSILIYASVIAVCMPAALIFSPNDAHIQAFSILLGAPVSTIAAISVVISAVLLAGLWVGYTGKRNVFIVSTAAAAVTGMFVAVLYANAQMWSRSFYFIVISYFIGILPYWWPLQQQVHRRYRIVLHGIFIVVGGVLLIAILVINLFQQNAWKNKEKDFGGKIKIAQTTLQNETTSVQGSLQVAAANRDFVETIHAKDMAKLTANAKILYESNPSIRRLVFLDADGGGVAMYPYGEFDEANFAHREYFQQAKATGKPYVSGLFLARPDHVAQYVVSVAVPFYGNDDEFLGVMVASLDLKRIGLQLDQIAMDTDGEYFVVADSRGNILLHPNESLVGTTIPDTDPLNRGLKGESGVVYGEFIEKTFGMIAYADVPALHWSISLRAKINNVMVITSMTIWSVISTAGAVLISTILVMMMICNRIRLEKESSP